MEIKPEWVEVAMSAPLKGGGVVRDALWSETVIEAALTAVAPLIAAEERERCALAVERNWQFALHGKQLAAAIRALKP